jgi:hypothetical protein
MNGSDLNKKRIHSDFFYIEKELAGGPGVAPSYVNLESTRSHFDPPPAAFNYSLHHTDVKLGFLPAINKCLILQIIYIKLTKSTIRI